MSLLGTWWSAFKGFGRGGPQGKRIKPGEMYVSSLGGFRCGPFSLDTTAEEHYGPHGGSLHLKDEVQLTRVDIEEFEPPLEGEELVEKRAEFYKGYLAGNLLPLVQSGVPDARLLDARVDTIEGHPVLKSAILTPGFSPAVSPEGKRIDGIRGQIQYTNGRFMFTVTRIVVAWPGETAERLLANAYASATEAYRLCEFPRRSQ